MYALFYYSSYKQVGEFLSVIKYRWKEVCGNMFLSHALWLHNHLTPHHVCRFSAGQVKMHESKMVPLRKKKVNTKSRIIRGVCDRLQHRWLAKSPELKLKQTAGFFRFLYLFLVLSSIFSVYLYVSLSLFYQSITLVWLG